MNFVIVESPTKARTLSRFLGDGYQIEASMGHILDLPKSTLGVDIDHSFKPEYTLVKGKEDIVRNLKTVAKKADTIILATDPDREGEAIAWHVASLLGAGPAARQPHRLPTALTSAGPPERGSPARVTRSGNKFQRVVFHEITKEAIMEAFEHPRDIDKHLVDAQTARRVLDRLVGYKLSPLLWKKVRRGLSAGRVQSVAVRLIVEREREIEKFKKEEYWTIVAFFSKQHHEVNFVEFELIEISGEKIEGRETFKLYDGEYQVTKTSIVSQERADEIIADLKRPAGQAGRQKFVVSEVLQKEVKRTPAPPFTTSTLQQEAARRLGFSGKRTMSLAQKLYEEGFITYHRTDSVMISKVALFATRNFIKKEYGDKYLPQTPRFYKTRQKLAQEAHEAIRPTRTDGISNFIRQRGGSNLGKDAFRLYELVWRRAVASQMSDAILESTTVFVDTVSENSEDLENQKFRRSDSQNVRNTETPSFPSIPKYRFKATGSVLVFEGFLKVNPQALEDKKLPKFEINEEVRLEDVSQEEHETQPPPRYNYATLVATLEEKGIGRPSTYAPIVETIEVRRYVELEDKRFIPTPVGIAVNDFLVANFSDIDDIPFTAEMEDRLDDVAKGDKEWIPVISQFYGPFENKLSKAEKVGRIRIEAEETNQLCDKCGSKLVIRIGKYGRFLSCSRFPDCDFTKAIIEETNFVCPKCGSLLAGRQGKIIIKKTKRGRRFYGCSNYPACNFAAWKLTDIKNKIE